MNYKQPITGDAVPVAFQKLILIVYPQIIVNSKPHADMVGEGTSPLHAGGSGGVPPPSPGE